ncbi:hypothetical protein K440DRAFT_622526, partial [Wilcoxina mikolae CBS 423.85]
MWLLLLILFLNLGSWPLCLHMLIPTVSLVLHCLQLTRPSFIVSLAVSERTRKEV